MFVAKNTIFASAILVVQNDTEPLNIENVRSSKHRYGGSHNGFNLADAKFILQDLGKMLR
jgi:hypothetical protein